MKKSTYYYYIMTACIMMSGAIRLHSADEYTQEPSQQELAVMPTMEEMHESAPSPLQEANVLEENVPNEYSSEPENTEPIRQILSEEEEVVPEYDEQSAENMGALLSTFGE